MKYLEQFLQLFFPPNCLICQSYISKSENQTYFLCPSCESNVSFNHKPSCIRCSRPVHATQRLCPECLTFPKHFDFAWAACIYNQSFKKLLLPFKYHDKLFLQQIFKKLIFEYIKQNQLDIEQFDLIIPISLHSAKQRFRGYNQSKILAKHISDTFNIKLETKLLKRTKFTQSQTELNQNQRHQNVKNTFQIKPLMNIRNQNILLIDDLLTTGTTVSEAAKTLKNHGANVVAVLTLAITP